jgi:hypothetical protein
MALILFLVQYSLVFFILALINSNLIIQASGIPYIMPSLAYRWDARGGVDEFAACNEESNSA